MKQYFSVFLCLFCLDSLFSQALLQIEGSVTAAISHQPIENVRIRLLERQVETCEGIKRLLPLFHRDFSIITGETFTDAKGKFSFVYEGNLVEYYALELLFSDNQRQYVSLIYTNTKEKHVFNLEKTPSFFSTEIENALEMAHHAAQVQLENEKINTPLFDGRYPAKIATCFDNQMPQGTYSCTISVPTEVYVSNLIDGYNSTATGPGFTGMIPFDEYVAGVVQKEIGGVTTLPNALKALAVAARTFSYRRHTLSLPVNIGQAYDFSPTVGCISAADSTAQQVMLYNNAVMNPNYAARCNGNFTQNSEQGRWGAGTCGNTCATCGNQVAYLRSVICSGHLNCIAFPNELPCCELTISTVNSLGNIYGHGVGLCQRGTQQFAGSSFNWSYCDILTHYYTGVCITNTQCSGGNTAFSVATIANPMPAGTITGGGIFNSGGNVSLSATANNGFSFVNWTENGTIIGSSSTYNSNVTGNRNIVANFAATMAIENEEFVGINAFPNPAINGEFNLLSKTLFEVQEVTDIMGKTVDFGLQRNGNTAVLQLKGAPQGIYFCKLRQNKQVKVVVLII